MEDKKKDVDPKQDVKKEDEFERDAKMFLVDLELLQKKYNLILRPIITPYGPDINLARPQEEVAPAPLEQKK